MRKKILDTFVRFIGRLHRQDEGQSMIEYGLIIALIAVVVVVTLSPLGGKIASLFTNISSSL